MVLELIDIKDTIGQKFEKFDKILCCKCQDDITNKRLKYYDEKFFMMEDIKQYIKKLIQWTRS